MARFKTVERLKQFGEHTCVGAGGDLSDFQYIVDLLDELMCVTFSSAHSKDTYSAACRSPLALSLLAARTTRSSRMVTSWAQRTFTPTCAV